MTRRTFSPQGREALYDAYSSEVWLMLLTVETDAHGIHKFVNNPEDIVSRGHTYLAYGFSLTLPDESVYSQATANLVIDNIDRRLVTMFRDIRNPPRVTVDLVRASDPDTVEMSLENLYITDTSWTAETIEAALAYDDIFSIAFPSGSGNYTPRQFPTMF